jgi:hypothetical protein
MYTGVDVNRHTPQFTMASIASRRLVKELSGLKSGCPAGIKLLQADDLVTWTLSVEVLGESLYKVCGVLI